MTREEAINEIKSWAIPSERGREVLETLIPELAESEDEKNANALIRLLNNENISSLITFEAKQQWLDWLERKKIPSVSFNPALGFDPGSAVVYHNDESEDERIRKALIDALKTSKSVGELKFILPEPTREECLAYLEKQKNLISYYEDKLDRCACENLDKGIKAVLNHPEEYGLEKQKEQKSNLVPKIIRPKFAVGDTVCRNMWSDHTIREIYIDCDDPVYICINEEGIESHISFSEQDEWERKEQKPRKFKLGDKVHWWYDDDTNVITITGFRDDAYLTDSAYGPILFSDEDNWERIEQKPAEWSEEDKEKLNLVIDRIYDSLPERLNFPPKQEWSEEDINDVIERLELAYKETKNEMFLEDIMRLKSLRPQPKKELSIEKAIKWLDDTFIFLDNSSGRGRDCEITTHDFDSLEEMYDSFRKAVIVDSEPHWKPSEEQLEALKKALHINPANGKLHELKENEVCILQSLLRELEKL